MLNHATNTRTFLLVDDDLDDTELFNEAVEAVAPAVHCINVRGGKEALKALEGVCTQAPDIIFLDINMPIMNGWQVLTTLKEREGFRDIPVILYSTSMKSTDLKTALAMGAVCFFTKPDSFGVLKFILQIIVEYMDRGDLEHVCEALNDRRLTAAY